MELRDFTGLAFGALAAHRLRSALTLLGIAVGVAAVVLLTSIGEGVHRFVLSEFTQFGTRLLGVTPGRTTTLGLPGAIIGTVRPLSLDDAEALRRLPHVEGVVPVLQGNAAIESANRSRRTTVIGVGPEMLEVWSLRMATGRFLPPDDPRKARTFAVLGAKVRRELFKNTTPLGRRIRIGGDRYRVLGVTEPKGQVLGFDLDDVVYIPAARALDLFGRDGLMEIDLLYGEDVAVDSLVVAIRRLLKARHGQEDFTITTQDQMLDILGSILNILTFAVGVLGGISLLVGGVGIVTLMTIAVTERRPEIGLLRALGATRRQVLCLFLGEAVLLSVLGGLAGLGLGWSCALLLRFAVPELPVHTPWSFALMAEGIALSVGLVAGITPARRAAGLDPVEALRSE